ncbi:MAG TPA: chemotaxis protein CheW [Thauera sp.]|jgi:purine-binding chemotaxis protein CheW|uniref:chemotaxis protein CheW n=1 Tax=Thauera sp. TaxID=1905334 RepID=UPI00260A8ED3|nr:chemotaxis protein CheW [Thauera sp.]MCP5224396.1 purine-binding chemotaxis protein CheW [Thauera sp.]HPE03946.1 chemotaxis protein CheW [Thauera sp.]HRV78090.1 chemotaxis protein CheW [Thauera sp.]
MTQSSLQTVAPAPVAAAGLRAGAAAGGQYLVFTLGGEVFAIDILQIREIIEFGELTEVPMTPPTVRGVINLRGAVVPVIDLAARFGRERLRSGRRSCIVIVEVNGDAGTQTLGVMVDGVSEVIDIAAADIEPAPSFGARIRTDFIAGMARREGRFVILLEVGRVFSIDELAGIGALAGAAEH